MTPKGFAPRAFGFSKFGHFPHTSAGSVSANTENLNIGSSITG